MDAHAEARRLVDTYTPLIMRLGYTYLKSREDAEDICQETLMELIKEGHSFPAHSRWHEACLGHLEKWRRKWTRTKVKKRYLKCDLLIQDDLLLEKVGGKQARELLEIVEGRLRTGFLLICSQFSPADWHAKLGEGVIADAVVDRIVSDNAVSRPSARSPRPCLLRP